MVELETLDGQDKQWKKKTKNKSKQHKTKPKHKTKQKIKYLKLCHCVTAKDKDSSDHSCRLTALMGHFKGKWQISLVCVKLPDKCSAYCICKHQNLVTRKLVRVKFPPRRDKEAGVSRVSPSSELERRLSANPRNVDFYLFTVEI